MDKDFDTWNTSKKEINDRLGEKLFHEREIWWCVLGVNIGHEQDGRGDNFERPVVIVKKLSSDTCVCVPLSTKKRLEKFQSKVSGTSIVGYALLDQIRVIDSRRLVRKISSADFEEFKNLVLKLKQLL